MDEKQLALLHLADSALPVGGYAFSSGLEAAVKTRVIQTSRDFRKYLKTCITELGEFDLPILNSIFVEADRIPAWSMYDCMLSVPEMRNASLVQGRAVIRLLAGMYPEKPIEQVQTYCSEHGLPVHYMPVIGMCLQQLEYDAREAGLLYAFGILRDQVSTAIRLGLVGPLQGHKWQREGYEHCVKALNMAEEASYQDAARSGVGQEITQSYHHRLYSRLFQN